MWSSQNITSHPVFCYAHLTDTHYWRIRAALTLQNLHLQGLLQFGCVEVQCTGVITPVLHGHSSLGQRQVVSLGPFLQGRAAQALACREVPARGGAWREEGELMRLPRGPHTICGWTEIPAPSLETFTQDLSPVHRSGDGAGQLETGARGGVDGILRGLREVWRWMEV